MINYSENLELINSFLKHFNTSITEINSFQKFLFYSDNKEVAFLDFSVIYDRIEINYILVLEDYRKRNIATKLLNKLIILAEEQKCINISLEVNVNNTAAINFYEKNGFKKAAVRKNYYKNEDGILMIREMM